MEQTGDDCGEGAGVLESGCSDLPPRNPQPVGLLDKQHQIRQRERVKAAGDQVSVLRDGCLRAENISAKKFHQPALDFLRAAHGTGSEAGRRTLPVTGVRATLWTTWMRLGILSRPTWAR